ITDGKQPATNSFALNDCSVPPDVDGPMVIWITNDSQPLSNNVLDRVTTQVIAGPAIIFVDAQIDSLGALVVNSSTNSSSSSAATSMQGSGDSVTFTTDISSDKASSIIGQVVSSTRASKGSEATADTRTNSGSKTSKGAGSSETGSSTDSS